MQDPAPSQPPSAAPLRLKRRADFLRAAKGRRFHAKGFTLQAASQSGSETSGAASRFGFTVTKKVGNAVVRNRIRRRLKEALRIAGALPARPGCDYVFIARIEALRLAFLALQAEIVRAIGRIEGSDGRPPRRNRPKSGDSRNAGRPKSSEAV